MDMLCIFRYKKRGDKYISTLNSKHILIKINVISQYICCILGYNKNKGITMYSKKKIAQLEADLNNLKYELSRAGPNNELMINHLLDRFNSVNRVLKQLEKLPESDWVGNQPNYIITNNKIIINK